ncbi:acyl-CoA thioesterase [Verticiella sediminum]|uniref:Acyl-CoA thioesterase n=1 Tax=Verticiella sediminum TaxID=1247510 RepID=A0A556AJD1_9BURK|nr:thioesterase family protein [Verticiella sediminum]TSH92979.1 acyl-CoA thioesterase [Verticiella sediminum]
MQATPFETVTTIRFRHCDPAGIVFYPRYFELINDLVETWFETGVGVSFHELHVARRMGIPTVSVQCDFRAVSRWDDRLRQRLHLTRLGNASLQAQVEFAGDAGDVRLCAHIVLVTIDLDTMRSAPLPQDMRAAMQRYLIPSADAACA